MRHYKDPPAPLSDRIVCPCGCIFQAVSDSDECWNCERPAGAIRAEEERIVASIRGLPEPALRTTSG